jgi:phage recombination protein Bet
MNDLAIFEKPRLSWHDAIGERFGELGVNKTTWRVVVEALFPNAATVDSVILALSYCAARKLDPFKKPVHIVPVWSSIQSKMVETVWPSIAELRTTAMRTGLYAGCDETQFGPDVTAKLDGAEVTYPSWACHTLYRLVGGSRVAVVGPKVFWVENYATKDRFKTSPNAMWYRRPRGQIEKVAEAGALRRAFPEELGNEYAAEEMEGRVIGELDTVKPSRPVQMLHGDFEPAAITVEEVLGGDSIPEFSPPAEPIHAVTVETAPKRRGRPPKVREEAPVVEAPLAVQDAPEAPQEADGPPHDQVGMEEGDQESSDYDIFSDAVSAATSFIEVKRALVNFRRTDHFRTAGDSTKHHWQCIAHTRIVEMQNEGIPAPGAHEDPWMFSLALNIQPHEIMMTTFADLKQTASWAGLNQAQKDGLSTAVEQALGGNP